MKLSLFAVVAVVIVVESAHGLYADPGIEVLRTMPEEGAFARIGEFRLPASQVNNDSFILELKRQAEDMEADAIFLFKQPAAGEPLVMTDDRLVVVGVAIKYE